MTKSGRKWRTDRCGRCEESHTGYSGKIDAHGVEYVVCGKTNKRMNVRGFNGRSFTYKTNWVQVDYGLKQRLRVWKFKFIRWCGFKLTPDERSELAYWITRKVKEPTSETLRKVRSGESIR